MNVPRDYADLFKGAEILVKNMVEMAPDGNSQQQLEYVLAGLRVGFKRAEEGFANIKAEPPQGANAGPAEKVTPLLDFSGRWVTRGGFTVELDEFKDTRWIGYWTDPKDGELTRLLWDEAGNHQNDEWTLTERIREAQKFANG